jgi:L-amino acid N-acyltransferase YncA
MSFLFKRKRSQTTPRIPVVIPASKATDEGFSFEHLDDKTVEECIETITKAMPQVKWGREGLRRGLLSPGALTLIARREKAIVGLISGTVSQTPSLPPTIGMMMILDRISGERGLGGYLIDEFIKEARKKIPKAQCIDVSLPNTDTGSIALYSLKGFIVEGFIRDGFRPSSERQGWQDLVLLRRYLEAEAPTSVV